MALQGDDRNAKHQHGWNGGGCCGVTDKDDVAFTRAIVKWLTEHICLREDNVVATGMYDGAFLANRLACEASDLFRAVVP